MPSVLRLTVEPSWRGWVREDSEGGSDGLRVRIA